MNFLELAKSRYSVRKYKNIPIEKEKINSILEAAWVSPTAANKQPNRFLVISDPSYISKLQKATATHGAPLVIIVCGDKNTSWTRSFDNASMIDVDASIATDHMMLEAENLGLGSCWITYFNPEVLRSEFNIPDNLIPVNILAIGYSDENPKSSERHKEARNPIESSIIYDSF